MTAAAPDARLRRLAYPAALERGPHRLDAGEPPNDRIFVTLLSLNFMLLAFFIVLGAGASVDKPRARSIAENVRIAFSGDEQPERTRVKRLTARQALQAGISDAFAAVLPTVPRFYVDNSDRIDVAIPEATLTAALSGPDGDSVYDNVAQLLQKAPSGFRYVILISGGSDGTSKIAYDFAGALVDRGVSPQDILVGSSAGSTDELHMSFLVFEGEADEAEPWSAGLLAAQAAGERQP